MNLIKKLGIIAIGAVLMAGCTPKSAVAPYQRVRLRNHLKQRVRQQIQIKI